MFEVPITDHTGRRWVRVFSGGKIFDTRARSAASPTVPFAPHRCARCAKLRRLGHVPAWLWLLPLAFALLLAVAGAVR
jgi:hypothetical protein